MSLYDPHSVGGAGDLPTRGSSTCRLRAAVHNISHARAKTLARVRAPLLRAANRSQTARPGLECVGLLRHLPDVAKPDGLDALCLDEMLLHIP